MNVHERIAGTDGIAFLNIKLYHTPRQFSGDSDICTFNLPLDIAVGAVHEYETDYGNNGNCHYHTCHGYEQGAVCAFFAACIICLHNMRCMFTCITFREPYSGIRGIASRL